MTDSEKKLMVDIQLKNLCELLGGNVIHVTSCDSNLRKCKKYIITYELND